MFLISKNKFSKIYFLLKLSTLLIPYIILFCTGVIVTILQSFGLITPLPYNETFFNAYIKIFLDNSFFKSFGFSLWVAAISSFMAVSAGAFLSYRVWGLSKKHQIFSVIYKIPLILPHIAVAFIVIIFWSRSGIISSVLYKSGIIKSMYEFPNILYSGFGLGMIAAYFIKGTPFIMILCLALLAQFDIRQIQTAKMLGASNPKIFFFIIIPRLMPALHTGFIILFLYSFGAFDIPYILGESKPGMLCINVYDIYFKHDLSKRPEAMAILSIIFFFCIIFIFLYSKAVARIQSSVRKL